MLIMGISASVGLTIFLFTLQWEIVTALQSDVTVVREDVAYIKGSLDRYWLGQNLTSP